MRSLTITSCTRVSVPLLVAFTSTAMAACTNTTCINDHRGALPRLTKTIQVPDHPLDAFDVSWLDPVTQRFYLADRANAGVEVIDAANAKYLRRITGFAGNADHDHSGPNGVVVIPETQELWAGDGDSTVKVVNLETYERDVISTGGNARADEISYDAADHLILVVNNAEERTDDAHSGAFATLISTEAGHAIRGKIVFHEATAGLEQSVWDRGSGLFYLAVPELDADPSRGAIVVIDPLAVAVVDSYPVSECQPAGLALGRDRQLLVGCSGDAIEAGFASKSIVLSTTDGSVLHTFTEVGGSDEVWFNPGDGQYYLAARDNPSQPALGVIDAASLTWRGNVPTGEDSKSVAVDPVNNYAFVGLTPSTDAYANDPELGTHCEQGCIGVFSAPPVCSEGGS